MTKLLILLAGLTTALLLSGCEQPSNAVAASAVYYVAPDGDDANPGTQSQPWRTIQKAADTLVAGDIVYIRAGTYHERVVPQNSGSAGQFITYAAYPGETATIDGTGVDVPEYGGLFDLAGRDYIRVAGLRVIHSGYYGIVADGSSYITIEHNYTYDTYSSGISSWGSDNVIVDSNEVVGACTGPWQEHISISNTDAFEVRYNHVHDVMPGTAGKEGLAVKDASSHGKVYGNQVDHLNHVGIYVDAEAEHLFDVAVYQNAVHDIPAMGFALASEQGGLLENVRLYNNIAYNNLVGLWLSACCTATHPFRDITIINNTFAYNGRDTWGGGIGIENTQVQNVVIRNNICSQNLYFQIAIDPLVPSQQAAVDHNLIDGYRGSEGETRGNDYVEGDPRFVNAAAADFHLRSNSPAIDRGSAQGAPDADLDGNPRPQDGDGNGTAEHDIGAYEAPSPAGTSTPTATPTSTPAVTPTPTTTPPPPNACLSDANANGLVDVVDIMTTAQMSACWAYLPLIVNAWRQPWPTPTPTANGRPPTATPTPSATPTTSLLAVNDFLYQLQNLDLAAIGNTAYDLVVMDYSADGSAAGEFTAAQINALKHSLKATGSPGGEKMVLAYMSIGEAEDYRFYWQNDWTPGNPSWLDAENPNWPGNYKVHYWDPAWQAIIFAYTDRLLNASFDGAYLDVVDAYEYYADRGRATAAQEMADFVAAIRAHARARDPDFYIFPQNAAELATLVSAYLNSVDGIGQEDIYYGYEDEDQMTLPSVTAILEGYLDVFKNAGGLVLTVDYATTPAHIDDAYARSQAKGYVPFVTVRDLDQLTINPGHEPD